MLTFNTSAKELNVKCSCKRWTGFLRAHDGDGGVPLALDQSVPCAVWHLLLDKNEDWESLHGSLNYTIICRKQFRDVVINSNVKDRKIFCCHPSPIISERSGRSITSRQSLLNEFFGWTSCELTHLQKAYFKQWDTKSTVVRSRCDLVADLWSICLFAHRDVWKEKSWTG